jgi:hypothetical protein
VRSAEVLPTTGSAAASEGLSAWAASTEAQPNFEPSLRLAAVRRHRLHRPTPRAQDEQKGTIQLRPEDAAGIPDEELRNLVRTAVDA